MATVGIGATNYITNDPNNLYGSTYLMYVIEHPFSLSIQSMRKGFFFSKLEVVVSNTSS